MTDNANFPDECFEDLFRYVMCAWKDEANDADANLNFLSSRQIDESEKCISYSALDIRIA